jgi:hypothetical protein
MKLNIEINDSLREFLERQAVEGGYASVEQYIESLIAADRQQLEDQARGNQMLLEIARAKGDVTEADRDCVNEQILGPRLESLRREIQEAIDSLDRGDGITYESIDELVEDVRQVAAKKGAEKAGHPQS